ncbi:hypothetical protein ACXET9_07280 [Brachybacterium sp. DNPG3]
MAVHADVSELRTLARDLGRVPDKVHAGIRPVIQKGALNIKTEMQMDLASSAHFHGIAFSPSFDTTIRRDGVEAVIGPEKGRAGGALANVAIFGTSRGGGTVPDPSIALQNEAPRFEQALADLLDGAL